LSIGSIAAILWSNADHKACAHRSGDRQRISGVIERGSFLSFLFWYVVAQSALMVVAVAFLDAWGAAVYLGLADVEPLAESLYWLDNEGTGAWEQLVFASNVVVCIAIAGLHRLGLRRGIVGFVIGALAAWLVLSPYSVLIGWLYYYADAEAVLAGIAGATFLQAGLTAGAVLWRWQRHRRLRRAGVGYRQLRVFD
jgi:hypothetical protein